MGKIKEILRMYIIDKPSFMSTGKTYITDDRNKIILEDSGTANRPRLEFIGPGDMPYILAPEPVPRNYSWIVPIKTGRRVFPINEVDPMPNALYNNDKDYRPIILSRIDLKREELDRSLGVYNRRLNEYLEQVREKIKEIDTKYQPELKKLKRQIKSEKMRVLRRKPAGINLVKIVLSGTRDFPDF